MSDYKNENCDDDELHKVARTNQSQYVQCLIAAATAVYMS